MKNLEELKGQVDEISNKYDLDVDTTELKEKAIAEKASEGGEK